ncbi:GNAT family N-acetyltransferase [Streptomyces endophyticus]|uniref:GNAT family N-acetyltransferase n=1 Tax=Streptomyces endophyticus TaxID=714166 RepID=A0ABU6FIS4_9ACTN|nr:GNAT family N-acetyltransferase [Streptomyces endophyticus]MEB8343957.1 GNAT family N-acetyltransferase [Streptomyces endophyticus]
MTTSRARTGEWLLTSSLDEFDAQAGELLASDPSLHTVALSVTARMRASGWAADGARFGVWTGPGGRATGYFFWTPPHFLYVALPGEGAGRKEAADALVDALAGLPVDGANGALESTAALAGAWLERHPGARAERVTRQRLFRLGELTPPKSLPEGGSRVAGEADRGLLADWHLAFEAEAHARNAATREQAEAWADERIAYGGITLWEDAGGAPVSMAGLTRGSLGTVRVAPVYTPPALRGRGYAAAVTAEVSRAARAGGAEEVLLFTDLSNPTSNALYQRLGYRPVREFAVWEFTGRG